MSRCMLCFHCNPRALFVLYFKKNDHIWPDSKPRCYGPKVFLGGMGEQGEQKYLEEIVLFPPILFIRHLIHRLFNALYSLIHLCFLRLPFPHHLLSPFETIQNLRETARILKRTAIYTFADGLQVSLVFPIMSLEQKDPVQNSLQHAAITSFQSPSIWNSS